MADTAQDKLVEGTYRPRGRGMPPEDPSKYSLQLVISAGEDPKDKPPVIVIDKDTAKLDSLREAVNASYSSEDRNRTGQEHPDEPTELVTLIEGNTPPRICVRSVRRSKNE